MNPAHRAKTGGTEHLPSRQFRRIVRRYEVKRRARSLSCWDQFLCMTFAQLTYNRTLLTQNRVWRRVAKYSADDPQPDAR
jgi:hypothetical protein